MNQRGFEKCSTTDDARIGVGLSTLTATKMNRREPIAGLGSLSVLNAGAAVYTTRSAVPEGIEPIQIETVSTPSNQAGATLIPETGRVTFSTYSRPGVGPARG